MPPRTTQKRALDNPGKTNAEVEEIIGNAGNTSEIPEAPEPDSGLVRLPGGVVRKGEVYKNAVVRELNGFDEEALSKALKTDSMIHFVDVLVSRATEEIGGQKATPEMLKNLLIGDRDELVLAIRRATYGDELKIDRWQCPSCGDILPISFNLGEEVERKELENPAEDTVFTVELRNGARAKVRLPNGYDQDYLFEDMSWTSAQRNSRLLTRCVMAYITSKGKETQVVARPSIVQEMSITDRQAIVREISERQPGPQYNRVTFTHDECGNEVVLALGIADLFRDLISFL